MHKTALNLLSICFFVSIQISSIAQVHPRIYVKDDQKSEFLKRMERSQKVDVFVEDMKLHLQPYVERHKNDPEWIVSRLQMYWKFKYEKVFVKGMDFSHGEGEAPVPTVRFSGSRDWATDYRTPDLEDVKPYMDDERGVYFQNGKKVGEPWEWVHPSETGHIIEKINEQIMEMAAESAFLFWLTGEEKYAIFAKDIFVKYIEGMYHREPPQTVGEHRNKWLMGLQTFEVIHERIVEHLTICYDFLYSYLKQEDADIEMIQTVFQRWADQEIKYGVPDNNWNLMQALYITYLALALEGDEKYDNGKGQEYYIDQVLNQNSFKQKALKDVMLNYDQQTGVWPEVAGYNMLVGNDMMEIFAMMDKTLNNNLVAEFPIIEKANLVIFQYLFPNGYTVSYGDAKHSRIRFNAYELLLSNYRKYGHKEKEKLITSQLKKFIEDGAYSRENIRNLFQLFYYVEDLMDVSAAESFSDLTTPAFYAPNVSWVVQRNGNSPENGMMISKNASLGNHSHTNGINLELYAKGMIFAPDCAAGVSYWTKDHHEYYAKFPAHNTVVVDGKSDYGSMKTSR
ncbi:MAG: heparinase II/III family protein, partial [Draconibacterium sp.]|nr:heparinase II/III family protein [Draconibacterium sp.]